MQLSSHRRSFLFFPFLILATMMRVTSSFSSGSVELACGSMRPIHFPFGPQSSSPPYTLSAVINNRGLLDVTIAGIQGTQFKGFFLQALSSSGENIGRFIQIPQNAQFLGCRYQASSVSHNGSDSKRAVTVEWDPAQIPRAGFIQSNRRSRIFPILD